MRQAYKGILLNEGLLKLLLTVHWDFPKAGCTDEPTSFSLPLGLVAITTSPF